MSSIPRLTNSILNRDHIFEGDINTHEKVPTILEKFPSLEAYNFSDLYLASTIHRKFTCDILEKGFDIVICPGKTGETMKETLSVASSIECTKDPDGRKRKVAEKLRYVNWPTNVDGSVENIGPNEIVYKDFSKTVLDEAIKKVSSAITDRKNPLSSNPLVYYYSAELDSIYTQLQTTKEILSKSEPVKTKNSDYRGNFGLSRVAMMKAFYPEQVVGLFHDYEKRKPKKIALYDVSLLTGRKFEAYASFFQTLGIKDFEIYTVFSQREVLPDFLSGISINIGVSGSRFCEGLDYKARLREFKDLILPPSIKTLANLKDYALFRVGVLRKQLLLPEFVAQVYPYLEPLYSQNLGFESRSRRFVELLDLPLQPNIIATDYRKIEQSQYKKQEEALGLTKEMVKLAIDVSKFANLLNTKARPSDVIVTADKNIYLLLLALSKHERYSFLQNVSIHFSEFTDPQAFPSTSNIYHVSIGSPTSKTINIPVISDNLHLYALRDDRTLYPLEDRIDELQGIRDTVFFGPASFIGYVRLFQELGMLDNEPEINYSLNNAFTAITWLPDFQTMSISEIRSSSYRDWLVNESRIQLGLQKFHEKLKILSEIEPIKYKSYFQDYLRNYEERKKTIERIKRIIESDYLENLPNNITYISSDAPYKQFEISQIDVPFVSAERPELRVYSSIKAIERLRYLSEAILS